MRERRRGGNSSDSDSALGGGSTPYRRRSPQHPFWLSFLDPALEAAFVAWHAQQQFKVGVQKVLFMPARACLRSHSRTMCCRQPLILTERDRQHA